MSSAANHRAFPHISYSADEFDENEWRQDPHGLTKREWMAGQVAAGWLANPEVSGTNGAIARDVVEITDAILAELARTEGGEA